jgi:pilus assembly protein CpaB
MKNNILPLAIGLILAVAAIFMLHNFLEEQKVAVLKQVSEQAVALQQNQVIVLVARKPIPAGAPIVPSMIDTTAVSRNEVNPSSVRNLAEIEGKAAARAISPGEQISNDALRIISVENEANGLSAQRLSEIIPEGKRAIGLSVDNIASLIDMLKPGDHVDVYAVIGLPVGQNQKQMMDIPIFQDVTVLAVGNSFGQVKVVQELGSSIKKLIAKDDSKNKPQGGSGGPTVTVALSPEEISVISFVQEEGKIKLSLRQPGDTNVINYQEQMQQQVATNRMPVAPIMDFNAFYAYLVSHGLIAPPRPVASEEPQEAPAKQKEKPREVEVYRGDKKEVKELQK